MVREAEEVLKKLRTEKDELSGLPGLINKDAKVEFTVNYHSIPMERDELVDLTKAYYRNLLDILRER